ncbi:uncharacterized protein TNCV_1591181 [Trichonephila clavipes]|nr:uncharacterized protein TNCV_1591181 [Trichonephila clavipes]
MSRSIVGRMGQTKRCRREEVQKLSPDHPVRRGHNKEDQFDPEETENNSTAPTPRSKEGHLKGRALDWFEVLGYRVIEDKETDYAHLKRHCRNNTPWSETEMSEEKLIDHVVSRLEPQILDYDEVRHPQNTANLLQIVDKYEERFMNTQIRGSSEGFRSSNPNENNRFNPLTGYLPPESYSESV